MTIQVANKDIWVEGTFPKIVKLGAEYFEWVEDPENFIKEVKERGIDADLFTFLQREVLETTPKYDYYCEWDKLAVLKITTYENWWKNQIRTQVRNRIRKAEKTNVELRLVDFSSELMEKIKQLYDEVPIRQGQTFHYYNKNIEFLSKSHERFLNRSQFIGAFHGSELIGFAKVVHDEGISYIMKLISRIAYWDKAPANALLAKVVEICAERQVRYLGYSTWCSRGLGEFKKNHAFVPVAVPRYYIPLNLKGKVALSLTMHRRMAEILPPKLVDTLAECRTRLNEWRIKATR
jgi:hypothetical protein